MQSSTASLVTTSGWSSASRYATAEPRSWPATAKRSWSRCRINSTTAAAIARFDDCEWSGRVADMVD
jgi:hypothetical protein